MIDNPNYKQEMAEYNKLKKQFEEEDEEEKEVEEEDDEEDGERMTKRMIIYWVFENHKRNLNVQFAMA